MSGPHNPQSTPWLGRWQAHPPTKGHRVTRLAAGGKVETFRTVEGYRYSASTRRYQAWVYRDEPDEGWQIRVTSRTARPANRDEQAVVHRATGLPSAVQARDDADQWVAEREYARTLLLGFTNALIEDNHVLACVWSQVEPHRAAISGLLTDILEGRDT